MHVCKTRADMRTLRKEYGLAGTSVGLVPTMGYLHEGHMTLVRRAKSECDRVIVTIFVNPAQFNDSCDLEKYPRDMKRDLAMLRKEDIDIAFIPSSHEMYPEDYETTVNVARLSQILIGRIRPGHFRGVITIITKLFNLCQPDRAYFGEKDYQQLLIIRRMTQDLDFPVKIVGVPTVREDGGLAMSSRNVCLSSRERQAAKILSAALFCAVEACSCRPVTAKYLHKMIRDQLETEPLAGIRSIDIRDAETLAALNGIITRPAMALLSVKFGDVLLFDQHALIPHPL